MNEESLNPVERLLAPFRESAKTGLDFATVRAMRDKATTLEQQRYLALQDRRAFAREYVRDNPVTGPLAILFLSPAEQVVKAAGFRRGRSGFFAPLANIGAGYTGALEGLATLDQR